MCVGCGGTCADAPEAPRFTQHAGGPDLRVVGNAGGPNQLPDSVVRRTGNGLITYEDLYTGLDANGKPALLTMPGTFGTYAQKAGRA
jgi:hypothetical protein